MRGSLAVGGHSQSRFEQAIGLGDLVQRKVFWLIFVVLGLIADFTLPMLWALLATLPIIVLAWWVAYRSGWF